LWRRPKLPKEVKRLMMMMNLIKALKKRRYKYRYLLAQSYKIKCKVDLRKNIKEDTIRNKK
jgi:hypothetical protein